MTGGSGVQRNPGLVALSQGQTNTLNFFVYLDTVYSLTQIILTLFQPKVLILKANKFQTRMPKFACALFHSPFKHSRHS